MTGSAVGNDRQRGWHVCRLTTHSRLRRASRKDSPRPLFRAVLLKKRAKVREYGNISRKMQRFPTVLLKKRAKVREYGNISRKMQRFLTVLLKIQAKVREYGNISRKMQRFPTVLLKKRAKVREYGKCYFMTRQRIIWSRPARTVFHKVLPISFFCCSVSWYTDCTP